MVLILQDSIAYRSRIQTHSLHLCHLYWSNSCSD